MNLVPAPEERSIYSKGDLLKIFAPEQNDVINSNDLPAQFRAK